MKKLLLLLLIPILFSFQNSPSQRKIKLELTEQEVNVVLKGLAKLPMEEAYGVYMNIVQQSAVVDTTKKK